MKWIKVTERVPTEWGNYFVKWKPYLATDPTNPSSGDKDTSWWDDTKESEDYWQLNFDVWLEE